MIRRSGSIGVLHYDNNLRKTPICGIGTGDSSVYNVTNMDSVRSDGSNTECKFYNGLKHSIGFYILVRYL